MKRSVVLLSVVLMGTTITTVVKGQDPSCTVSVTVRADGDADDARAPSSCLENGGQINITWTPATAFFVVVFGDGQVSPTAASPCVGHTPIFTPLNNSCEITEASLVGQTCSEPNALCYKYFGVSTQGKKDPRVIITGGGLDKKHKKHRRRACED